MANNKPEAKSNEIVPVIPGVSLGVSLENPFGGLDLMNDLKSHENSTLGVEALDSTDLKLPKIKLVQATSAEVALGLALPGEFFNAAEKKAMKQVECVLLIAGKTRVLFKQPFRRGDKPLCRSINAEKSINGKVCKTCEYGKWENVKEGERPPCFMSYSWLGLLGDGSENNFFRFTSSVASTSNTRDFINVIVSKGLPFYSFKVVLTSELVQNQKGSFYVVKYTPVSNIIQDIMQGLNLTEKDMLNPDIVQKVKAMRDKVWEERAEIIKQYRKWFERAMDIDTQDSQSDDASSTDGEEIVPDEFVETQVNAPGFF
jgi:hypothetical protein